MCVALGSSADGYGMVLGAVWVSADLRWGSLMSSSFVANGHVVCEKHKGPYSLIIKLNSNINIVRDF